MPQRNIRVTGARGSRLPAWTCAAAVLGAVGLSSAFVGCADSTPASTRPSGGSSSLMSDPVNYQPSDDGFPDVSGGGIGHFDKKGFNRDLDSVLNP